MTHTADQVIQQYSSRILGYLVRRLGDFDDAEDLQQEVTLRALENWRRHGIPENPLAWLFTTARNRAIDFQRRTSLEKTLFADDVGFQEDVQGNDELEKYLEDDLLRLIFTCCHPALGIDARVALTLRSIAGFTLDEAARAFIVAPRTMEQRLVRAKRKIKAAGIAYEIPGKQQIKVRLDGVLQTIYLIFNEGYSATSGEVLIRQDLCNEAIHLGRMLLKLFRGYGECLGLLSLMLLQDSRRHARVSAAGNLVLLDKQDRALWDKQKILEGKTLLEKALLAQQAPGPYQIQAAIAALHVEADTPEATDWPQIVELYTTLKRYTQTPVVKLNHAVALMMINDLEDAESEICEIGDALSRYFPFFCARADLYIRQGKPVLAMGDLERAVDLTHNATEATFLREKLIEVRKAG